MKTFNTRMTYGKKKRGLAVRILRGVGIALLAVVVLLAGGIGFLSATEYRPADRESVELAGGAASAVAAGDEITVVSWNVGYGALGDNADFFMDGGTMVQTADADRVEENLEGILKAVGEMDPDVLFLQETDWDSARSRHVNEVERFRAALTGYVSAFAENFKVAYLPYPVPPMGKVDSGVATFSAYPAASAQRIQLPIPFSWPIRMANLKRCLLVMRVPVEGSDRELVLVNLHLEAYDDGEGKLAQTRMLAEFLETEAAAGNWVIAGGDFNQIFSSADTGAYPAQEGKWAAGEIDVTQFGEGWQFLMDARVPSCRSLDQPYAGADRAGFQYYLIDGFIVSANLTVEALETRDLGFVYTDHNPVLLRVTLGGEEETP